MPIDLPNARIQNDTVHAENVVFSVSVSVPSEEVSDHWTAETMHTHPYPELFICQSSGIGILTSQGSYVLNPMQMLMIPPGISHVKLGVVLTGYPSDIRIQRATQTEPTITTDCLSAFPAAHP